MEFLRPKKSAKFIMEKAKDVTIDDKGIEHTTAEIYKEWSSGKLGLKNFKQCEQHPKEANEDAVNWIFVADTLNFSFWSGDPGWWEVEYKGKSYTGYFALCAAINRAIENGVDILNPKVFGSFNEEDILRIFASSTSTPIPMVSDRVKNLKNASQVLLEKYDGSFVNCVKAAGESAHVLVSLIVADFASYRDENDFEEKRVSFWKRAQILVGDIWACFEGKGLGTFHDIDTLTMFADYRIPQVLLYFGALKYSKELMQLLENDEILQNGDRLEIEIRGASIHAVELIKDQLRAKCQGETDSAAKEAMAKSPINSIMIDHFLWDYRRDHVEKLDEYPYHKVRCIYY